MAPTNYNNYYDPVGSQANQPNGYTYQQQPATSNAVYPSSNTTSYAGGNSQGYGSGYANQYTGSQTTHNNANRTAAAALSSLGGHDNRADRSYGSTSWTPANYTSNSGSSNGTQPSRTQAETSMYGNQPTSGSFGRLSMLNGSTIPPTASNAYAGGNTDQYNSWYSQQQQQAQQQPPHRFASPLHAVQAQQQQRGNQSRSSTTQRSPHLPNQQSHQRQQSGSVEPPQQTTVDPSQVYDIRAEQQRKAHIELERKRKRDEAAAARKAEEDRIAEEKRKAEEAAKKVEEEKRAVEEAKKAAAAKAAEKEKKAAARKRAIEEKKQSKSAAATLANMASSSTDPATGEDSRDEEAQMRAMFLKMREFNAKNPQMLAKLWEEERKAHSSPAPPVTTAPPSQGPASIPRQRPHPSPVAAPQQAKPAPAPAQAAHRPAAPTQMTQKQAAAPLASSAQSSLWPPHKKGNLADVAAKWLTSLPSNSGKTIHKDDIFKILDGNPNYVQLCEALEALGVRFERALLARELLKAVPDSDKIRDKTQDKAQPARPPKGGTVAYRVNAQKNGKARNVATVSYEAPNFTPLPAEYAHAGLNGPTQVPSAYVPHGGPVMPPGPSHKPPPQPSEVKEELRPESAKPEEPYRAPANKEEAARKRTFTDLVDLTAGDSDDEAPPKMMKFSGQPTHIPQVGRPRHMPPSGFNSYALQQALHPMAGPSNYPRGLVPSQNFPLPPMPPPATMDGPSIELQRQRERIRGKMLVEPIMRDRVARKNHYDSRTIARDVLLATGRHPDMRSLNSHLMHLEKMLGAHGGSYDMADGSKGNRSDLSTIRWDLIDPEPPGFKRPAATVPDRLAMSSAGDDSALVSEVQDVDADDELDDEPVLSRQAIDNGDGTMSMAAVHGSRGPVKGLKHRGRPPGSGKLLKSKLPSGTTSNIKSRGTHDDTKNVASTGTPQPRERPSGSGDTSRPVGYAAFRNLDANGVKKKGRPVGWRKAIHSREAQGLTPAKPGSSSGPSRLRPTKDGDEDLKKPVYQVYKCKWLDCPAELHNLETLKKHVVKVHGKPSSNDDYECLWQGCEGARSKGKGKAGSAGNVLRFDGLADWIGHVDEAHLQPVAWKLGDGPRGGQSDWHETTDSEAYLSDAHGRSVTPVIRPGIPPPSSRVVPDRPLNREERKAAEELQKLEERKRTVGFTMEKSGVTLANAKRRRGFMDDEDFEDVIDEDEPDPN